MLSKRLNTVLDYIDSEDKLADIGCDHGYLALYAIYKGVKFVELVDNKQGPLNAAKENLKNVTNKATIIYSLSDGLNDIRCEVNTIAICGMGGDLISKIILDNLEMAKKMNKLILEANSKVDILRKNLNQNDFKINDETIVYEKGKYYQIIYASFDPNTNLLSEKEIEFGPILLKNKTETFIKFIKDSIDKLEIIDEKNQMSSPNLKNKINKLKEVLNETK